jgi:3D-(3,5/4)-trihydroxycyclohexane-1,2-dione acylhydrolase (decyclizing)
VDGRDAHKLRAHPVVADAREALTAIAKGAAQAGLHANEDYTREVGHTLDTWRTTLAEDVFQVEGTPLTQAQLIGIVNANAQPGDTIVAAAGSPPGDLLNLWDASDGRKAHLEFGYSCMGYEIPASLGVRLAEGEGPEVFTFIGDGTYMMNPTEIATAVQEGLKITVLISQNDGFQCIRDLQLRSSGKDFGNEFRHRGAESGRLDGDYVQLDLAANAAAFGARAFTANTAEELEQALADARAETRPCVIVVPTDRFARPPGSGVWWDVSPAEVSQDPATMSARKTYDEGRKAQRYYG